jgi:uncharacterized radical SAM superfamily Fe-S cluster-containing enzyme
MQTIKNTKSICPECLRALDATIFEENGKVFIKKECPEHGAFQELYWSDFEQYQRAEKFRYDGKGIQNPRTQTEKNCPLDCGICPEHKSHTALAIIDVTNRCNLTCPVCFANAAAAGYVYEPTQEQVVGMLTNLRATKPVPATALQFSGGEPTIRNDLFDLIMKAKEVGFRHVEVNTNGVRVSRDVEYAKGLKAAGISTVYLQFDGLINTLTGKFFMAGMYLPCFSYLSQILPSCSATGSAWGGKIHDRQKLLPGGQSKCRGRSLRRSHDPIFRAPIE